MTPPVRTVSHHAALVLEHVAAEKRRTLLLPEDGHWLQDITAHVHQLLDDMESRKSLYRVVRGKYVVAPRATDGADQAAPPELLVDLVLRSQGDYYLGFLSAFIAHGLTDLHSDVTYAAIKQDSPTDLTTVELPSLTLQIVRLSPSRWPEREAERERRRVQSGTREFSWRSSLERTLVDGLLRPELCAGIETVIGGWARVAEREVDWDLVWSIGRGCGVGVAKRVAYLLRSVGHEDVLADDLAALRAKRSRAVLDRSDGLGLTTSECTRDPATGLTLNVPQDMLRGWLGTQVG